MQFLNIILLIFIIVCALSVAFTRNLLTAIVIFMSQSLAMCLIWVILQSPDLAITEAAVGAGTIWFEACAVCPEGRTGVRQMRITEENLPSFRILLEKVRAVAKEK